MPQTVAPGESIEYIVDGVMSDPKAVGILANGYPHSTLKQLALDNKYQAFYATKMALWCYLIPSWNINSLGINPDLTGSERTIGERLLAAAKKIYINGAQWTTIPQPTITIAADKPEAYEATIDGKTYLQQVFSVHSETWVGNLKIDIAFAIQDNADAVGAKIVDMDNKEIIEVPVENALWNYDGKYKILVPVENADKLADSMLDVNLAATVYKYEMVYAICAETDKYGQLQNYLLDTDPVTNMAVKSVFVPPDSVFPEEPPAGDDPAGDTAIKIVKLEEGTKTPLAGAVYEVVAPDGTTLGSYSTGTAGTVSIPITEIGDYTVTETIAPRYHLLPEERTQHVRTYYGKVGTVTFVNALYGELRVEKIDAQSGGGLAGAKVQIKHIESGATYTQETGPGGAAQFTELKPGAYEIQELTAPEGWRKDPQTYTTTVVSGEAVTFTLKNEALPGLTIVKYDSQTHMTMLGVTFEIFRDTVSLGRFETNALGEINLTDLQPGTYRVVEVDTGDTGHLIAPPQEIELTAGGGIRTLYFFNDSKPGIWLVKVDAADPSKVIPNAVFTIRSIDGSFGPKEFTTNAAGEIDLSELPTGSYEVVETSCPGYIIDNGQRIIHLEANQTARFVFTNSIRPSLNLIKLSADGSALPGVTFRIARVEDGSHYLDRTTNAQGEILISDLEPGVYSVKETATRADHLIDPVEHHIELFPGRTSTIVLNNNRRPSLTIHKNDADTGAPVAGAVFTVRAADGHTTNEVKTGPDGTATLENLLPIVYEVTEKSVPAPYLLDTPSQLITLYPNKNSDIFFENHKKPSLVIEKMDSITGNPIQGAKFQVWYGSNSTTTGELNSLGTYFTDEAGRIELAELRDGWYKVTELEPAKGYSIKAPDTQECYIKGGEGKVLTFQNVPLSALVVYKYDQKTGAALEGAIFEVRYLGGASGTGGTVIGAYRTSVNGSFTVTGLKAGAYVVEEVRSSPHHTIDTAPQTAYITGEDQDVVKLYFGNLPHGAVLIKKLADDTNKTPLAGAVFLVTDDKGAVIGNANGEFTTDKSGAILISDLPAGTTVIAKELRAPEGYALDGTPQTLRVEAGETHTLSFYDKPLCNLTILKRDSVTKQPLAGAEFLVTDGSGAPIGENNGHYTSGSDGLITLTGLTPGQTVVVREEKSPAGYVKDPNPQTITVQSGKLNSLTFDNAPKGTLIIVKLDGDTKKPLAGAQFQVVTSSGAFVPDAGGVLSSNGLYTTDKNGQIMITGLEPDTLVVTEIKAPDGYVKDGTPQTVVVNTNDTQTLYFYNTAANTLTLQKYVEGTTTPIQGVTFLVTDSSGAVVGPNNGKYVTDRNGRIVISGLIPGVTITARETKTVDGFVLDSTPQSILIKEGEAQRLTFFNKAVGGLELIKVDEADRGARIPNVEFEVHKMDGGLVGTYTTDKRGRFHADLDAGDYYLAETRAAEGYRLDDTPIYFTVKDNETTTKTVTNKAFTGILIHKVDSVSGKGIYGVTFLVYDRNKNPIDQVTTDQRGYAYVEDLGIEGRVYLRELEAEGYLVDEQLKTVYVRPGETTEVEWQNTPITGQFQITKYAAEDNTVTGQAAGTALPGAVFEIVRYKSGVVVDYITTNARGVAVSEPLPLGRYLIREVTAPAYYQLDGQTFDVELEFAGQIVRMSAYNKCAALGVTITKTGNKEVLAGSNMTYSFKVANNSNVALENFYWHDRIPTDAATGMDFITGTYSQRLNYRVLYKTNYSDYRVLASNLLTTNNYSFALNALPLQGGEVVTDVYLDFGTVPSGFQSTSNPMLTVGIGPRVPNGYSLVNRADAGGKYQGTWETATTGWVTIVRNLTPPVPLPKTGY